MPIRIREFRNAKLLSQNELARKVGISQETLSRFERGQRIPKVHIALRIARILGTTVEELFGDLIEDNTVASSRNK